MQKEFVLFSRDYYPGFGGVAHYTSNFFTFLRKKRPDTSLIVMEGSTGGENIHYSNIVHQRKLGEQFLDGLAPFRKLNTYSHYQHIRKQSRKDIEEFSLKEKHLIVTACYDIQTLLFLDECRNEAVSYSIVFHGLDLIKQTTWPNQKWVSLFKKVVKASKNLLFNSKATQQLFSEKLQLKKNSTIVYPGIDPDYINDQLKVENLKEDEFIKSLNAEVLILSVGSLVKRKGFDIAIKAVKTNIEQLKGKRINFLIAGDGSQREELESIISANNLHANVQLLGAVSESLKFKLLQKSSLFLMPSYTMGGNDIEGFGIVFLEAAYLNNYIIGGASGGMPEAIAPLPQGRSIEINNKDDSDQLAKNISIVLNQILNGENAIVNPNWISNFHWASIVEHFLQFALVSEKKDNRQ